MELLIELLFELVFALPILRIIILAVVPALALLMYVRRKDALEPEPPRLIWTLVGFGAASVLLAMLLETAGLFVMTKVTSTESVLFEIIQWFVIVGLSEEISKCLVLRWKTWRDPAFNCTYDGLVYAVAVSAGFALTENVMYLFRYGTGVLFMRAIVSIPAHISFSVFMGAWYSAAKKYTLAEETQKARNAGILAVVVPALAHGAFDYIASNTEQSGVIVLFVIYIIAMFVASWLLVKKLAEKDTYMTKKVDGIY